MKTISVLINSYNYGHYIAEAIASVLAQTIDVSEIVVVDDGSTDNTRALLESRFGGEPRVKVIHQRNGGQMAAFVTGFDHATGDYVFMLDADDLYTPRHVASVVAAFEDHPEVDFIYTAHQEFGDTDAVQKQFPTNRALGFSLITTLKKNTWIGSVTSTLALRRSLMLTLLPVLRGQVPRWQVRAEDCLVMGSSLAGCQKYYLAEPTVRYRVHGKNNFYRNAAFSQTAAHYAHGVRRESLKACVVLTLGVSPEAENSVEHEFECHPEPPRDLYRCYVEIVWGLKIPLLTRIKKRLQIARHFHRSGSGRSPV